MRKSNISQKKLLEFGLLIGFGFPLMIGWIIPSLSGHSFRFWSLWVSYPSITLAIFKPNLLFYPYKAWMLLGLALGWINSRIILSVVYLLVLQPIALIMKIFGYDPLRKKVTNNTTYREINNKHIVDFKRIF